MRNHVFLCIGLVCVLALTVCPVAARGGNTPTVDGSPVFATSTDVKLATIRSLVEAKDYPGARQLAEQVTTEAPGMVDGWLMLGYTRMLTGSFAESNDAYDRALEHGAETHDIYSRKAYNCRRLGDADATRECYRAILSEDPDNVDILMQFGMYESQAGNNDGAVGCFEAVVKVQPDHLEAIQSLAKSEEKRGNVAQTKYWLEQGLSTHPDSPVLLKKISLVYLNEQNYTLSIHYLNRLLVVEPESTVGYRNLGIAHYQQGNKREATEAFARVQELDGTMDGLYGPLADCYRSIGKRTQALEVIKQGIEEGQQVAWLYSVWGKLLEDGKEYDLAIDKFNRAVGLRDEPWSGYARKQIARQTQLKKRQAMIAAQGGME